MKVTHFFKDATKHYWRIECTLVTSASPDTWVGGWDIQVFRSSLSHEDPDAQEVYSTSQSKGGGDEPNIELVIFEMSRYFNNAFLSMIRDVELYTPEWDKSEH